MMDKKIISFPIFLIIVSGFFFSGCQETSDFQTIEPKFLEGSWKVDGSPEEYQTIQLLSGQEFKIDANGDGTIDILGYYQLDNDRMIFIDKGGTIVPACHREGVYTPQLRNNRLSFQLVRDECPGRLKAMKHAWQKTV